MSALKASLVLLLWASVAVSDEQRVLLPVAFSGPGANGSFFETMLAMRYVGPERFVVLRGAATRSACVVLCSQETTLVPNSTQFDFILTGNPGLLLYVDSAETLADLRFNLRVVDRSRETASAGTEIPVVPESMLFATPIDLLNVPVGSRFRTRLRIYSLSAEDQIARVRVYDQEGAEPLIREEMVVLRSHESPYLPTYGELADVTSGASRLAVAARIEVAPVAAGQRLWAFVSVTNNETQQITVVCPTSSSPR